MVCTKAGRADPTPVTASSPNLSSKLNHLNCFFCTLFLPSFPPALSPLEPPLPTSDPPKKKPVMAKSKSLGMELYDDTMEDEYIPMDPIYTEPPVDETEQPATPSEWRRREGGREGGRKKIEVKREEEREGEKWVVEEGKGCRGKKYV